MLLPVLYPSARVDLSDVLEKALEGWRGGIT